MPSFETHDRYKDNRALLNKIPDWFPLDRRTPEDTYEIALSLAGAISGGAYTAGFMDFLFQALDEWYLQRDKPGFPKHQVCLKTITGASAGSIVAALAAFAIRHRFRHGDFADQRLARELNENPFYQVWVKQIDIRRLLATDDLAAEKLDSLLNSQPLETISRDLLQLFTRLPTHPELKARQWAGDSFSIHLTLSNLCGVPYSLSFKGDGDGHLMRMHRDYVSFAVPASGTVEALDYPPNYRILSRNYGDPAWAEVLDSALASSAFPAAFSARVLNRPRSDYDWLFVGCEKATEGNQERLRYHFAEPLWNKEAWKERPADSSVYRFLAVDGGAMNNEPFDIAHRVLAGLYGQNPRDAMKARRGIIMVDPFPELPERGLDVRRPMIQTLLALITGWKNNARFKAEDLFLASADEVYSRFLVVPKRPGQFGDLNFTAAGLGGFLALFDESYRHYDFFLGRINAYKFLRDWFVLPRNHSLFVSTGMTEDMKDRYKSHLFSGHVQIIPLVGTAAVLQENQDYLPPWPSGMFTYNELDDLRELIDHRVRMLLPLIAREAGDAIPVRGLAGLVTGAGKLVDLLGRKRLVDFIMRQIEEARRQVDRG